MSQYSLPGGEHHVSGKESAGLRVVVPGLQIVPLRLFIVNVASVAKRVQNAQRARQRSRARELFAPGIVSICNGCVPVIVNELYNISLSVADVVVIRSVEVNSGDFSSF